MASPTNMDLASVLAQATEAVNTGSGGEFEPVAAPAAEPEADHADDFGPEQMPEAEEEPQAEPLRNPADIKKSARRWIEFVDNLQKPLLVASYRRTVLKPGDEHRISDYEQQRAARGKYSIEEAVTDDSEFYYVLERAREFTQLCEAAPFTDDEKESLAGPLAEVLEKHARLQLTPEMALVMAVAMVMLPRVAPLIPQFRNGFKF